MASYNDVTGDSLTSKTSNNSYRSNYDKIFGKKKPAEESNEKPSDKEKKD